MEEVDFDLDIEYDKIKKIQASEELNVFKQKLENKTISQKEYKIFYKLNNIIDNMEFLDNIMKNIDKMRNEIIEIHRELEERITYNKIKVKENHLRSQIELNEERIAGLKKEMNENDMEDKDEIKAKIGFHIKEIEDAKDKLREIQETKEKSKGSQHISFEDDKKMIIEIKERIQQYSIVAEKLIRGHTLDEAIEYLLKWQRERYKLENKEIQIISNDIKKIREDWNLADEITRIAYEYIEEKEEDR